jgi:hypothetical protein
LGSRTELELRDKNNRRQVSEFNFVSSSTIIFRHDVEGLPKTFGKTFSTFSCVAAAIVLLPIFMH